MASLDHSRGTAPTSQSGCSGSAAWLSDSESDAEDLWSDHIQLHTDEHHEDEDEEIDPGASRMGRLSLRDEQRPDGRNSSASRHEELLARKVSIERATRTRLARTPSKRMRLDRGATD